MKSIYSTVLATAALAITSFAPPAKPNQISEGSGRIFPIKQELNKWVVDRTHSHVKFTVTHMVVSEVEGNFKVFGGSMEHTKPDFSDAKIEFSIDINSIDTDNENRDKHLRSDDFFNAEKYPTMKFVSTSFTPAGGNKYKLEGNLTIRDVTKPVSFDVTYGGTSNEKSRIKSGFRAQTTINRFDYGLKWDRATEAGSLVVSKDVDVSVNVEFKKV